MLKIVESRFQRFQKSEYASGILIVSLYLLLEGLRATYSSPGFDGHGDASYKWDLARAIASGEIRAFDSTNHHSLRWGGWLIACIFNLIFSDNLAFYLLSAMIPAILGGTVFAFLVTRALGFWIGLAFVTLWMIDPQLYTRTYTLMPSGATLFPLALTLLVLVYCVEKQSFSSVNAVCLAIICFWSYGIKETNLFFIPAVIYVLAKHFRLKYLYIFVATGTFFYFVESFLLWYFTTIDHMFGRLYELVFGSAKHLNLMNSTRLQGELAGYYDGGSSFRFYKGTTKYHTTLYFTGAYLAIINLFGKDRQNNIRLRTTMLITSVLFISFFFVNGFFVGGSELRPLQPLRPRYLVPLIPLALILLTCHTYNVINTTGKWAIIPLFALLWFFISEPINWATDKYAAPYNDMQAMHNNYTKFAERIENTDCVYNHVMRHLDIIQRWPPLSSRGPKFEIFSSAKTEKVQDRLYVKKLNSSCEKKLVMHAAGF